LRATLDDLIEGEHNENIKRVDYLPSEVGFVFI